MPAKDESPALELWRRGAFTEATDWVLHAYGPEIAGYLLSFERDSDVADDVYSECCTAIWRALPTFRGECSLRTFCYAVARRSWSTARRTRNRRREVPLAPELEEVAARLRTTTAEYLRTANKDRLAELRDALEEQDRALLTLRLDRKLDWPEIARVILDDEAPSPELLAREAAALRKRFERLKEKFRRQFRAG